MHKPFEGLHVLVAEDVIFIAMDVEDLCKEHGAREISIVRSLAELNKYTRTDYDAAVLDLMLGGESTIDFAKELTRRGVPFVFATGHSGDRAIFAEFDDVTVVSKPYIGRDLIDALAAAIASKGQVRRPKFP